MEQGLRRTALGTLACLGADCDPTMPTGHSARSGRRDQLARLNGTCALPMHITDLTHFLDASGGLAPVKGPARTLAQFLVDVVAHVSDGSGDGPAAPKCFKCKKCTVTAALAMDQAVVWTCPACGAEGRISNWQGTLWDLTARPNPQG